MLCRRPAASPTMTGWALWSSRVDSEPGYRASSCLQPRWQLARSHWHQGHASADGRGGSCVVGGHDDDPRIPPQPIRIGTRISTADPGSPGSIGETPIVAFKSVAPSRLQRCRCQKRGAATICAIVLGGSPSSRFNDDPANTGACATRFLRPSPCVRRRRDAEPRCRPRSPRIVSRRTPECAR